MKDYSKDSKDLLIRFRVKKNELIYSYNNNDFQAKIKYMNVEHLLVNSSRSRVKRFTINKQNKDKFFEYMFVDTGKIVGV